MRDIHIRQDDYTKRWHIYSAPFMRLCINGTPVQWFKCKVDAEKWLAKNQLD